MGKGKKIVPERICMQIDAIYEKVKKEVEQKKQEEKTA